MKVEAFLNFAEISTKLDTKKYRFQERAIDYP